MAENMLLSAWSLGEEEAYLVASVARSQRSIETSRFIAGLVVELDFSEFYLPDGVFQRLIAQCASLASEMDDESMEPQLSRSIAMLSLGFNVILMEVRDEFIRISVDEEAETPARIIQLLVSMLRKQSASIFKGLKWQLLLVNDANKAASYDKLDAARKAKKNKVYGVRPPAPVLVSSFDKFFSDEVGKLTTDEDGQNVSKASSLPKLRANETSHVFLSHQQSVAGDMAGLITEKLKNRGVICWFDKALKSGQLNAKAMVDGVTGSRVFILILTKGIFSREAVLMELRTAIENYKPIIAIRESETNRPGCAPMDHFLVNVPSFCEDLFNNVQAMKMRRYAYEEDAFYSELICRIQ